MAEIEIEIPQRFSRGHRGKVCINLLHRSNESLDFTVSGIAIDGDSHRGARLLVQLCRFLRMHGISSIDDPRVTSDLRSIWDSLIESDALDAVSNPDISLIWDLLRTTGAPIGGETGTRLPKISHGCSKLQQLHFEFDSMVNGDCAHHPHRPPAWRSTKKNKRSR